MRCRWICMARSLRPSLSASAVSMMSRSWRSRMPSLSSVARPKLSEMRAACAASGQASRTISSVVPLRSGTTRAAWRESGRSWSWRGPFFRFPRGRRPALAGAPSGAVDQNRRKRTASRGRGPARRARPGCGQAGPKALRGTRPGYGETAGADRCDLPLKRAVDGSDRSKPEGGPARVPRQKGRRPR